MKEEMNKKYEAPTIVEMGSLQQITLSDTFSNSDSPAGTPDTAFPVHS